MSTKESLASVFAYTAAQLQGDSVARSTDFAELKRNVKAAGLLDRQPVYYTIKFIVTTALFAIAIALLFMVAEWHISLLLLIALFWAFVYVQIGTLGHDAGHNQISRKHWKSELMGYLLGNLTIGMSRSWWVDKHNTHHAHPNQLDHDPDIDFPIIIFDEAQLADKQPWQRAIIKYQAYVFFPILALVSVSMRYHGMRVVLTQPTKNRAIELATLILYYISYFGMVFYALPFWEGLLFVVVHQACFGIYMGSIFAPNHKGMPILPADQKLDFLRVQVLTSRNVAGNPVTDFLYGGLNYQDVHHLFPTAPRNKLNQIHYVTKQFCEERGIPFYETGLFRSYVELIQNLHEVSAPLRNKVETAVINPLPDLSRR